MTLNEAVEKYLQATTDEERSTACSQMSQIMDEMGIERRIDPDKIKARIAQIEGRSPN
jgi:hypothetical protein